MVQAMSTAALGGNPSSTFRSPNKEIPAPEVNVRRSKKLPLFPGYYFFIMSAFSGAPWSNLSALEPFFRMDRERRALLDHASLCRRLAGETSHTHAAKEG